MNHPKPITLIKTFVALLVLLAATIGAAFLPLGSSLKPLIAVSLAIAKGALILLVFMQVRYRNGRVRIFALVGYVWLFVFFLLLAVDYLSR